MTILERFQAKIKINDATRCWEWQACKDKDGYGRMGIGGRANVKMKAAHRLSYEMHIGKIPEGMQICHRCDNPSCVNPEHLFPGTGADNIADMVAKGRKPRGSVHKRAKLSEDDVRAIRGMTGVTQQAIADRYGVSQVRISKILSRQSWAWLQ